MLLTTSPLIVPFELPQKLSSVVHLTTDIESKLYYTLPSAIS